jgi:hypothetical protein
MNWRLIKQNGAVLELRTKAQAMDMAGQDSYLWVMDRTNKTVIALPERHRLDVLEFAGSRLDKEVR